MELTAPIQQDELVERCRQGDRRSYGELYQKYAKAMYNTSLRIVNHTADAEDVLQESFCDAFAAIGSFGYKSTFGAWLKRIVINKSINALRKRKMDIIDIEKTNLGHLPEETGYDEEEISFKVEEIRKAVKELPNGYELCSAFIYLKGMTRKKSQKLCRFHMLPYEHNICVQNKNCYYC